MAVLPAQRFEVLGSGPSQANQAIHLSGIGDTLVWKK